MIAGLVLICIPAADKSSLQTDGAAPNRRFVLQFKDVPNVDEFPNPSRRGRSSLRNRRSEIDVEYLAASGRFTSRWHRG